MKDGYYFSESRQERVYIHKVTRNSNIPYDCCERCGKLLTRTFYRVNDSEGYESLYGSECIKHLKLRKDDEYEMVDSRNERRICSRV